MTATLPRLVAEPEPLPGPRARPGCPHCLRGSPLPAPQVLGPRPARRSGRGRARVGQRGSGGGGGVWRPRSNSARLPSPFLGPQRREAARLWRRERSARGASWLLGAARATAVSSPHRSLSAGGSAPARVRLPAAAPLNDKGRRARSRHQPTILPPTLRRRAAEPHHSGSPARLALRGPSMGGPAPQATAGTSTEKYARSSASLPFSSTAANARRGPPSPSGQGPLAPAPTGAARGRN